MTKGTLQRHGYTIKHTTAVGWWIDGAYGYLVAGYYSSEGQAVTEASKAIAAAKACGRHPCWML